MSLSKPGGVVCKAECRSSALTYVSGRHLMYMRCWRARRHQRRMGDTVLGQWLDTRVQPKGGVQERQTVLVGFCHDLCCFVYRRWGQGHFHTVSYFHFFLSFFFSNAPNEHEVDLMIPQPLYYNDFIHCDVKAWSCRGYITNKNTWTYKQESITCKLGFPPVPFLPSPHKPLTHVLAR